MSKSHFSRRRFIAFGSTLAAGTVIAAACQPATIEVTKIVEKPVEKVVEKKVETTKVVEKVVEVTKVVEKQVVVTASPKPRERIEIRYDSLWTGHPYRNKPMAAILDLWHQTHKPRIMTVYEGLNAKRIAADVVGDAIQRGGHALIAWIEMGVFVDISPLLKSKNYDWSDVIKHDEYYAYQGKYYGLPWQLAIMDWAMNKTLIENAGASTPDMQKWIWDDIVEVGRKVTNQEKKTWGYWDWFGFPSSAIWYSAIYSFGGDFISADGKKTAFGEGGGLEAIQWILDLVYKWKVHPTAKIQADDKISWVDGNTAFHASATVRTPAAGEKPVFEAVQMLPPVHPKVGKRVSFAQGEPNMITRWAKTHDVVDEATDFIIWLTSKEVDKIVLEMGGGTPRLVSTISTDAYAPKAARDVQIESNKYRVPMHQFYRSKYYEAWYYDAIQPPMNKAVNNEISLKEGIAQAVQRGDKALAGEKLVT